MNRTDPRPARLAALRQHMQAEGLAAWIVPSADPHLSEYLPRHWQTRAWLSGFSGSAGTLLVTHDHAGLWTDSRYWEQAATDLANSGITLHQQTSQNTHISWLAQHIPAGAAVGMAAEVLSLREQANLHAALSLCGATLRPMHDIAAAIWTDRPALPWQPVYPRLAAFVCTSVHEKLQQIRQHMQQAGAQWHLISDVADIAWITNLRGRDVSYNPVFLAHLLIGTDSATLWAETDAPAAPRFAADECATLAQAGIQLAPYTQTATAIGRILADTPSDTQLLLDPAKVATGTLAHLPAHVQVLHSTNPSALLKSRKSTAELHHIKQAMLYDGIALCHFFADLEQRLRTQQPLNELDIDAMLREHRSRQPHFVSPSFSTIAGFNANGALPHYRATKQSYSAISGDGLLLIDSGGQYHCGTTDITRVVPIGSPSAAQIRDFTLVLKAHIAMSSAVFPDGIPGPLIDAIGRAPLWAHQLDYGHGTGHGVGDFLNVHEGPQVLSCHVAAVQPQQAMRAGMVTSIEPGLYRPNQWGIRIENLVASVPVEQPEETAFGNYLRFEPLTLCPIDTRLIQPQLLTAHERDWVNHYHQHVAEQLHPHLDGAALDWLLQRTQPLPHHPD